MTSVVFPDPHDPMMSRSACILLLALAGCAASVDARLLRPREALDPVRCVAVLPFDNITRYPYAGQIAADLLGVELYRTRKFNVAERAEVERIFLARGIVPPSALDDAFAAEAGRTLGVEGVFAGTVSEYYYRKTSSPTKEEEPVVGMTVRFIDVATSQVLWRGTITRVSGSMFAPMREPINEVSQEAVGDLLRLLAEAVPEREIDPRRVCWKEPQRLMMETSGPAPAPEAVTAPPAPGGGAPRVAVMNGTAVPKAGEAAARVLLTKGVDIAGIGNAGRTTFESTIIYYRPGFKEQAGRVQGLLPVRARLVGSTDYPSDITVVVGRDMAR